MNKLPLPYGRSDLVLRTDIRAELDAFIASLRSRGATPNRLRRAGDVRSAGEIHAMFWGPAGTGKTMAAQVVAREAGIELFRVDLSSVVSKYVGETAKNLERVFDRAEAVDALLLFDEADALLGKRTDVKDSHDRFANRDVGYLTKRIEEHPNPLILATNRKDNIDSAFIRRLRFVIHFPLPTRDERRELWQRLLPPDRLALSREVLDELARDFPGSGGDIRRVVLAASEFAAATSVQLSESHLKEAVRRVLASRGMDRPR